MNRRLFVVSAASLAALRPVTAAPASRLALAGSLEQGSLVIGRSATGAKASVDGSSVHVSDDGAFAFGIAYDRTGTIALKVDFPDGTSEVRDVNPVLRKFEIQSITGLPEKYVSPSPEDLQRIANEHEAIAQARKGDSDAVGFASPFEWPAAGIISGVFGSQRILNGKPMAPHFGVDIASPVGSPIKAPADGTISLTGDYDLEGGFTLIDHGHGVSTCYLHQSRRLVSVGDNVHAGQQIGEIGMTGRATGPHLHWGLNLFQLKLDPSRSTRTPAPDKV